MSVSTEFAHRADPLGRELLVHCYRMLGSVHDAEDPVQETMLRAWRARDQFDERRASLRTWLYRIATNACLTALANRRRRPLPSGLVGPRDDPEHPLIRGQEIAWLQPIPDGMVASDRDDPATALACREDLRLALVAAIQLLPARQRAILILRDALDFSAAEVAAMLDTTVAAVNSALQRARAGIGEDAARENEIDELSDPRRWALIDQYVAAFENADIAALTRLLTDGVILEMPPALNWFVGREYYGRFIARIFAIRGTDWRMLPIAANGQPAVGAYVRGDDGTYRIHTLQVFSVGGEGIHRNVVFQDPDLFALFGLPLTLDTEAADAPAR